MFKYTLIMLCAVVTFAVAIDEDDSQATILSSHSSQDNNGHFEHGHETSNGVKISARGDVNGIQGEYFLPGENGEQIRVTYTADSTGFHPNVEKH